MISVVRCRESIVLFQIFFLRSNYEYFMVFSETANESFQFQIRKSTNGYLVIELHRYHMVCVTLSRTNPCLSIKCRLIQSPLIGKLVIMADSKSAESSTSMENQINCDILNC